MISLGAMSWYIESRLPGVLSVCFGLSLDSPETVFPWPPKASRQPFFILLLIPLIVFCSVSLRQQAKMKSHSLEHRSQEQPLLQPKQVQCCWQGSEPSSVLTPPQTRTREISVHPDTSAGSE